jgi:predicted glycogen debranching enzyme
MDARYGNEVITPRVGKPVEINGLWIDALDCMAEWAPCCGDDPTPFTAAASRAAASFAAKFWYEEGGYLYDVVDGPAGHDTSLRPNQLIALGSRRRILSLERGRRALARVSDELITIYGPRSLSRNDPRFCKTCFGDEPTRERAYHQGTVWPWLFGPYVDACRRYAVEGVNLLEILEPFFAHLREAGIGCVSGVFDGDPPHTPRGCIEQAWSVAELLRVMTMAEADGPKD